MFDTWRAGLEALVRSGTEHPAIEAHLSKYRSLVPSLAVLIHLAEGRIGLVSVDAVRKALAWTKYSEPHARRIYGLSLGSHLECRAIQAHPERGLGRRLRRTADLPRRLVESRRPHGSRVRP